MKSFTAVLLASAFALTATLAVAQSDSHHPAAEADDAPAVTEDAAPETAAPELQRAGADAACPDTPSMMMDMMTMMKSGDAAKAAAPLTARPADRSYEMLLTGDMAAYKWGLALTEPIVADLGDRIEVTMTNTSMMAHPMHLHGHHFQAVAVDGRRIAGAVCDTVLIPPSRAVTIAVDANNPGQWAFHCHHLYHMATGMMSTFGYRT